MQIFNLNWVLLFSCWMLSGSVAASQTINSVGKRLYVEAFATNASAAKLREDLILELRKSSSVALVPDEANADLVLGGGGEIWIKGYRSFSPRSPMKMSSNGIPRYGGYLSVELKDRDGVTIWSYLATPSVASEDPSKDLAKRIAKEIAVALRHPEVRTRTSSGQQPAIEIRAAGATFPYPVYEKWFTNFQAERPSTLITYEAIGSEAGVRKLLAGEVDFGASDSPEVIHQIGPDVEDKYLLFPSIVGAVVPIVNLPGVSEDIKFTPEALAGIFLGKITNWNDPVLRRANHGLHLPDLPIVVVHRADGSGTSYAWTDYLSKISPEWKAKVGSSLTPNWPAGREATGNDGVAKFVKELGGAIGYVEFIYALRNHLSYGKIQDENGDFVAASLESIAAAVNQSPNVRSDFKGSIVNAPGRGAYPVASFTWMVVPRHIADETKRSAITAFLKWMLGPGQLQAAALGYISLPRELAAREEATIAKIH